jgi:branched-chain amino acid transport system permease protein
MLHAPAWRERLLGRLVPTYLLSALMLAIVFIAGIALVEMVYHVESDAEKAFRLFSVKLDATNAITWIGAMVMFAIGIALFALSLGPLRRAWQEVSAELAKRGAL